MTTKLDKPFDWGPETRVTRARDALHDLTASIEERLGTWRAHPVRSGTTGQPAGGPTPPLSALPGVKVTAHACPTCGQMHYGTFRRDRRERRRRALHLDWNLWLTGLGIRLLWATIVIIVALGGLAIFLMEVG